jgi:hypothetical protein
MKLTHTHCGALQQESQPRICGERDRKIQKTVPAPGQFDLYALSILSDSPMS